MTLREQTTGLCIFFPVLTTITVFLRVFVRTRLCKGAFGWDDIALLVTWAGLLLWVGFAWTSMTYEYDTPKWRLYHNAMTDVCYIISGTVKISVALVLYRLDQRLLVKGILIADMVLCAVWTVVVTLILGIGCSEDDDSSNRNASPTTRLSEAVCAGTNYAQEASYVFFNVLHLVIPLVIVWGVQIRGNLKWAVILLFSIGLLAAFAAIMKLIIFVEWFNPTPSTNFVALWYRSLIWAVAEHGLSLFAASVLAIRPFFAFLSKSVTSLSSSLYSRRSVSTKSGGGGSDSKATTTTTVTTTSTSKSGGSKATELNRIRVRNEFEVRSEYHENEAGNFGYLGDASESQRSLVQGGRKNPEAGDFM